MDQNVKLRDGGGLLIPPSIPVTIQSLVDLAKERDELKAQVETLKSVITGIVNRIEAGRLATFQRSERIEILAELKAVL